MAEISNVIAEASQDLQTIEDFVNLPAGSVVNPRLLPSVDVGTLAGTRQAIFENGGLPATPFATKALMTASSLADGKYAQVTDDTVNNGLYVKTAGAWVKSDYDIAKMAVSAIYTPYDSQKELINTLFVDSNSLIVKTATGAARYYTFLFKVEPSQSYSVKVLEKANRFRVAELEQKPTGDSDVTPLKIHILDDNIGESIDISVGGNTEWLLVYAATISSTTNPSDVEVTPLAYKTIRPTIASGLDHLIDSSEITPNSVTSSLLQDGAVTSEKTDFLTTDSTTVNGVLRKDVLIGYDQLDTDRPVWLLSSSTGWSYEYDIYDNDLVSISVPDSGHNRLRIVALATDRDIGIKFADEISEVVYIGDDTGVIGGDYSFRNTVGATKLLITVNTGSSSTIDAVPIVTKIERRIDGLVFNNSGNANFSRKFSLAFDKIPNNTKLNLADPEYPRLACVNYEHINNDYPIAKGFLYTTQGETQEFLYSVGRPDNMVKVANWNKSITYGGNRSAGHYAPFITDDGDILCIFNGSFVGGTEVNPNARQNPIIYPANDYDNPVVIDFGSAIKPTAWIMDVGVVQIPNSDKIVFCEYTRPVHEKARIWTVTKPYTDPNNWNIVQEFTIDRPNSNSPSGNLKHIHMIKRDPWSGMLVCGVGDFEMGAKILTSKDDGDTWVIEGEGDESRYRVTQMLFTEDGAWWGSDSHLSKHIFWKANRNEQGYPVFGLDDIELVARFPNVETGNAATYGAVLMREPNGILFLDRQDNSGVPDLLKIYFWSFDDSKLYLTGTIDKMGVAGWRGFRFDAQESYQSPARDYVMVGFNDVNDNSLNYNAVAGNSEDNRLHNLAIRLVSLL